MKNMKISDTKESLIFRRVRNLIHYLVCKGNTVYLKKYRQSHIQVVLDNKITLGTGLSREQGTYTGRNLKGIG